ncbi:helix-turn-helix transcriptional regulator [Frankia gtarii]|uniref:helix-turn-helix transcriptional regulator n=1 Tax=Frankia gtarii TaxID=2950102 RepID=UPI0021C1CB81|nr:AAA family ATPase [Frankia gtarii]
MPGAIVGRERELAVLTRHLDAVAAGPAVLALWGEAGIGKTTLWEAGLAAAQAHGLTPLACRPVAAEVRLSYAGLTDLLADARGDEFAWLPNPQRQALDAALLRGTGDGRHLPDPRAVAAAFLSVLERLTQHAPVLVALDDVQWLDEPTRRVVAFAVRRCRGPIAVLTAGRDEGQDSGRDNGRDNGREDGRDGDRDNDRSDRRGEFRPRDPARLWHLDVGPLSLGHLYEVLLANLGRSFPRPVSLRIARTSGGNPFYALEIARSLDAQGPDPGGFPNSLRSVVRSHVAFLKPAVREALLVVSALTVPSLDLVGRACGVADAAELLSAAEDDGVIVLSAGCARFTHPLLASSVYTESSPSTRRALHRRLAGLVDDIEERARHLALAVTGPEPEVVATLDAAATQARRRGAASAAAELLELALGLGASDPARQVQAAADHFHADDPLRARELLERAVANLGPGPQRAEALALLGTIRYEVDDYAHAVETLQRAFSDAGDDRRLRADIGVELCTALANGGRIGEAIEYATVAVEEAEHAGDSALLAEALAASMLSRFLAGEGIDDAALARSLVLEDLDRRSHAVRWPSLHATMIYLWTHRVDEARAGLADLRERCLDRGAESDLWFLSFHAARVALWSGEVEAAELLVADVTERALMVGTDHSRAFALAMQAQVEAWAGRVVSARAAGEAADAALERVGMRSGALFAQSALGMLALSISDNDAAARWLAPVAAAMAKMGVSEPVCVPFLPDAAEALIGLGRLDEAEPLVEHLEASGRQPERAWAHAVGARTRGLLAAARGDLDAARSAYQHALTVHDQLPLSYERARTLLVLGQLQRRCNERRAAGATLEEAARAFDAVGAAQWAGNARAEVDRLGSRPGPADKLTPMQERVAELAAGGLTNREVAAALVISHKTVEANLAGAYRKLGIRSRAQLGAWLAQRHSAEGQPPGAPHPAHPKPGQE